MLFIFQGRPPLLVAWRGRAEQAGWPQKLARWRQLLQRAAYAVMLLW